MNQIIIIVFLFGTINFCIIIAITLSALEITVIENLKQINIIYRLVHFLNSFKTMHF